MCEKNRVKFKLLILTSKCNSNCNFCLVNGGRNQKVNHRKLINNSEKIFFDNCFYVISRGEPFLRLNDIVESVSRIKEKNDSYLTILTNGSLIDDEIIKFLSEKFGYYDNIQISAYSDNRKMHQKACGRDDWEKINETIKKLVAAKITVRVNLVVTPDNIDNLEMIYLHYLSLGVDHICISALINQERGIAHYDIGYLLRYVVVVNEFAKKYKSNYNFSIPTDVIFILKKILDILNNENHKKSELDDIDSVKSVKFTYNLNKRECKNARLEKPVEEYIIFRIMS